MKKLLLPLMLLISISLYSQQQVDLKIEEPKKNTGFMSPKGYLITGLSLNVIGTGIALLADDLVKDAPVTYSAIEHEQALRFAGNNTESYQVINQRYQQRLTNDIHALEQREKKVKEVKGFGIAGLAVGLVFDVVGVVNLFK